MSKTMTVLWATGLMLALLLSAAPALAQSVDDRQQTDKERQREREERAREREQEAQERAEEAKERERERLERFEEEYERGREALDEGRYERAIQAFDRASRGGRRADGALVAALPRKLPATTPLAELILDHLIWVRTEDGTLYPAPHPETYGLTWGYRGAGPGALARVIDALLDDITATAPDEISGAPEGLAKLARTKLPRGTVLTRRDLESARAGRWMPVFVDPPENTQEDK